HPGEGWGCRPLSDGSLRWHDGVDRHDGPVTMPRHTETRALPYSPEQMFDLVADVARYGEFLPWVVGVRVRSNTPQQMVADLIVGFKG
ncbi:SRPBCC family protein, partial [Acinetobacter baumannii]